MGCESSRSIAADELSAPQMEGSQEVQLDSFSKEGYSPPMTDFQMDCVRSTWPLFARKKIHCGSVIFRNIFAVAPEMKSLFSFRDVSDEDLHSNEFFLCHVKGYMDVLGSVCENLTLLNNSFRAPNSDQSAIDNQLIILGATHANLPGFDLQYIYTFIQCTHSAWEQVLGEEYTSEVREAWAFVFEKIAMKIAEGYRLYHGNEHFQSSLDEEDT